MKKTVLLIAFVVVAAAIIGWGSWYANQLSEGGAGSTAVPQTSQPTEMTSSTAEAEGLQITDTVVGTGTVAQVGDTVTVNYVGTLDNGTQFDASADHGQPFSFVLGAGQVIQGWDIGVVGMKVGGTRELVIPPELAYGSSSPAPSIPANSTLHFTIQLLSVSTSTPSE